MLQRFTGMCRRLFRSKGFRIAVRIFFLLFVAYFLYSLILYLAALKRAGVSYREAVHIFFNTPGEFDGYYITIEGIVLGIVIGLTWFFRRKKRKENAEKETEKPAEASDSLQEEEFIEPPRYISR